MRRVILLLVVLSLAFAPVPPCRARPAEQVLLSRLKAHGKVADRSGCYELSVGALDKNRLIKPVITHKNKAGQVLAVLAAAEGDLLPTAGVSPKIVLRQVEVATAEGAGFSVCEKTVELDWLPSR